MPPRLRDYYAYGVILCHSTYRKLIDGGYVAYETPRDNSQPDMPSKIVSTLLEILLPAYSMRDKLAVYSVSTLLEILLWKTRTASGGGSGSSFQPFLRFYSGGAATTATASNTFQPFLRFYRSCGWLLWVFKFFFGFLSSRRSAWNHALHSFYTALGESEAPFFGAPRKRKRGRGGKERHSLLGGFVGRGWVCRLWWSVFRGLALWRL